MKPSSLVLRDNICILLNIVPGYKNWAGAHLGVCQHDHGCAFKSTQEEAVLN